MSATNLHEIAKSLVSEGKGILAADESTSTIKKRFEKIGIEDSVENHRKYREMLFSTPGIEAYISGVIMYDETLRQSTAQGKLFRQYLEELGVLTGIKVDTGKVEAPNFKGEFYTEGLDGLQARFSEYSDLGAKFAKWRAVINVGVGKPSSAVVKANAVALARYATLSQEAGIVPIVEPEVLADGSHSIDDCEIATHTTLDIIFEELIRLKVDLSGMLLKPNMIIEGLENEVKASAEEIAERTVNVFKKTVPKDVAGIVFLSGGQSTEQATTNLCAVEKINDKPWPISFSYGRALQNDALETWAGRDEKIQEAQQVFLETAKRESDAKNAVC